MKSGKLEQRFQNPNHYATSFRGAGDCRGGFKTRPYTAGEPGIHNPRRCGGPTFHQKRADCGYGFRAPLATLAAPE